MQFSRNHIREATPVQPQPAVLRRIREPAPAAFQKQLREGHPVLKGGRDVCGERDGDAVQQVLPQGPLLRVVRRNQQRLAPVASYGVHLMTLSTNSLSAAATCLCMHRRVSVPQKAPCFTDVRWGPAGADATPARLGFGICLPMFIFGPKSNRI